MVQIKISLWKSENTWRLRSAVDTEMSGKKHIWIDSSYLNKTQNVLTAKCLESWNIA